MNNGRAYSLPNQDPAVYTTFDQAWQYCKQKGAGWHLMTNAEWSAVALWCKANGSMPNGNNNYGKDTTETLQKARVTYAETTGALRPLRVATGTGPVTWAHDNTPGGIWDLNGNVWEWVAGHRLQNGEHQVLANNDAADWNNPVNATSTLWKAISAADGSLIAPGAANSLKWNYLNSKITLTANATTVDATQRSTNYELLGVDASVAAVPEIMKALCLHPAGTGYSSDNVWATISDERISLRGGIWSNGASAGVFALHLSNARSNSYNSVGFRAAFFSWSDVADLPGLSPVQGKKKGACFRTEYAK